MKRFVINNSIWLIIADTRYHSCQFTFAVRFGSHNSLSISLGPLHRIGRAQSMVVMPVDIKPITMVTVMIITATQMRSMSMKLASDL